MIPDWLIQQLVGYLIGFISGVFSFLAGLYIYTKYFAAKQATTIAVGTAEAILNHPKVKPAIKKLKELEPLLEKAKELDLQELIDLVKGMKVFIELQTNKKPMPPPPKRDG